MARRELIARHRRAILVGAVFAAAVMIGGLIAFVTRDTSSARAGTPIPSTTHAAPTSTTAPSTAPAIDSFVVPPSVSCTGETDFPFSWSTKNASAVSISLDGELAVDALPVAGSGTIGFPCDGSPHSYTLTATGDGAPATRTIRVAQG
jgi:hypothetical protein